MLLVPIPWAGRVWALPFLTALAPSERYASSRHRHKPLTRRARQLIRPVVHRWHPDRRLVVVGIAPMRLLELLGAVRAAATVVARLRLDAQLCAHPPRARLPRQTGRPRVVGLRLSTLEQRASDPSAVWIPLTVAQWCRDPLSKFATQALLCTDQDAAPAQILAHFVQRWQLEVTFHALLAHLGMETQRQWTPLAIARTTPALLGLFSLLTLLAHPTMATQTIRPPQSSWYA